MSWGAVIAAWAVRRVVGTVAGGYSLVADIDTWRRTHRERVVRTLYDLRLDGGLSCLPLAVGDWRGEEVSPDPLVIELVRPQVYLPRVYTRDDGAFVWLSLIAGRGEMRLHQPQICYGGWHTVIQAERIPLARGEVYALAMFAARDGEAQLVYHFYLWPDLGREPDRGVVMFKVTAPIQGDEEHTRRVIRSFIATWFVAGHETF